MKRMITLSVLSGLLVGAILVILCLCSGCAGGRKVMKSTADSTVHDVSRHDSGLYVYAFDTTGHTLEIRDTSIGISSSSLSLTLSQGAGTDTTVADNTHSLHVYTGIDGRQHIKCKADSLTIVIRKLVQDREYLMQHKDTVAGKTVYKDREVAVSKTAQTVITKHAPWWRQILCYLGVLLVGMVIGFVVKCFV